MKRLLLGTTTALLLFCTPLLAQQTTGIVTGRILDQQGAALPGVTVSVKNASTGFSRSEVTDSSGVYRLSGLPVGIYEVTATLKGFGTVSKKDVEVNVSQTQAVDFAMKIATLAETVTVTAATP